MDTPVIETPVDPAAVQADEVWLNFLAAAVRSGDPLAGALVAWREDVESEPFPEAELRLPCSEPKRC